MALDASSPVKSYERFFWLRVSTLFRLEDVLHNRQVQGVLEDLDDIQRLFNVSAHAVGLRIDPDKSCTLQKVAGLAARIRTHFDRFSAIECAVLAYLGYYWANRWVESEYSNRKDLVAAVPMVSIDKILPEPIAPGRAELTEEKILAHLRYSHLRVSLWRHCAVFLRGPERFTLLNQASAMSSSPFGKLLAPYNGRHRAHPRALAASVQSNKFGGVLPLEGAENEAHSGIIYSRVFDCNLFHRPCCRPARIPGVQR